MYSFDGRVRYSECDEKGDMTLFSMMNYLQDCSTFHCEEVGRGLDALSRDGLGWFLTSWLIKIDHMPHFAHTITTSTWSYDMKGLSAKRAFTIDEKGGGRCVTADSEWCMYSFREGHVITIGDADRVYLENTPRPELPEMARRIRPTGEGETCPEFPVIEQYLDTNRHVNNAEYLRFALSALAGLGYEVTPSLVEVQYRKMALLGETITPVVYAGEGSSVVSLNTAEGKPYATVRLSEGK